MADYDAIVLGTGGVGSATVFHLARRGERVLGLDRFSAGHDRGSSHGRTRIIRQAYFEHPDYVPLVLRAYELWSELEAECGQRLYHEIGLLQVGPRDGAVLQGVRASARQHGLDVEELGAAEIQSRWPGYCVPPGSAGVYEQRAGYLRVEACVQAHLTFAERHGAELRSDAAVVDWSADRGGVRVRTERETFHADRLLITAGAWAGPLLRDLSCRLEVRRKPQYWYQTNRNAYRAEDGCPAFLYELPEGVFYGFPRIDGHGLKVAQHSGGRIVDDPLAVDREVDPQDQKRVEQFLAAWLPNVSKTLADHQVCMYTMTPDEHFVVDRHGESSQVVFAAGLSGHGFKFTGVLGEALADMSQGRQPALPMGFLASNRPTLGRSTT